MDKLAIALYAFGVAVLFRAATKSNAEGMVFGGLLIITGFAANKYLKDTE